MKIEEDLTNSPLKEYSKSSEKPSESREWWIDLLRVIIVLLVIPYHIVCSFVENIFGPGINFYVWNESFVDDSLYYILFFNSWQMHILFLFAGISLVYSLRKRTFKAFTVERVKKLVIPLVFGYIILIALMDFFGVLYVFKVLPSAAPGIYQVASAPNFREFYVWWWWGAGMVNPGHLWFLLVLLLFILWFGGGVWGIVQYEKSRGQTPSAKPADSSNLELEMNGENQEIAKQSTEVSTKSVSSPPVKRNFGKYVLHPVIVLIFALLSSQIDKLNTNTSIYALQWSQLLFFSYGIIFAFSQNHIDIIQKHYKWTFPVSISCFTIYLILTSLGITGGYVAISRSIGAWFLSYSLIGFASKKLNRPNSVIQYLSKAFMAIYILHLPLQIIIGYYLLPIPFNPFSKMIVLTLIVYALSFGLYEGIRRTKLSFLMLCFGINPPKKIYKEITSQKKISIPN